GRARIRDSRTDRLDPPADLSYRILIPSLINPSMPGAQSRVLVVEDDARLAATLQRVLAAEGHDVEVAGDGVEAIRRARLRTPDLAVLDVMLPGLDGVAVCRKLRETAQFPILMLTALSGTEDRVRG